MLFNSFEFLLFLPIVFSLYWLAGKNLRIQNLLLLVASYIFYGWWDWRFLLLIAASTLADYITGLNIHKASTAHKRKAWLWFSIIFNIGLLGFFKYYNFFIESWIKALDSIGYHISSVSTLKIILPVGISFYTFQTMSYSLDIYKRKIEPTKDIIGFSAFVAFFPQLVAGPIERASNLLPQILSKRTFRYTEGVKGLRLILSGLFKKVIIADTLGPAVDSIFTHYTQYDGGTLFLGTVFFAIQIYADFSGYSDIAIGTGKLFGIDLMTNFRFPYFSRDIAEFWRRWHISLTTWFRDYIYIPLGGSRGGKFTAVRNIFIVFLISGLWHGANWTYVLWGGVNALLFMPLFLFGMNRRHLGYELEEIKDPYIKVLLLRTLTFILVTLTWVFFRTQNPGQSADYVLKIFLHHPFRFDSGKYLKCLPYVFIMLGVDYTLYRKYTGLFDKYRFVRWSFYMVLIFFILYYIPDKTRSYIYFQF